MSNINKLVFHYLEEASKWKVMVGQGKISPQNIGRLKREGIGKSRKDYYHGVDKGTDNILKNNKIKNTSMMAIGGSIIGNALDNIGMKMGQKPPYYMISKMGNLGHSIASKLTRPKPGEIKYSKRADIVGPHVLGGVSPHIYMPRDTDKFFNDLKNMGIKPKSHMMPEIKRHEAYELQAANKLNMDKTPFVTSKYSQIYGHLHPDVIRKDMVGQVKSKKNQKGSGLEFTSRYYGDSGSMQLKKNTGDYDFYKDFYK